jgi:hypothetical protein
VGVPTEVPVPSQANGSRGWQRTSDEFSSWVTISVAVRSRNAVGRRRARDKNRSGKPYAKRHLHVKYAGNAARILESTTVAAKSVHELLLKFAVADEVTFRKNKGAVERHHEAQI